MIGVTWMVNVVNVAMSIHTGKGLTYKARTRAKG